MDDIGFIVKNPEADMSHEQISKRTGKWLDKKITIKKAHGIAYGRWGCSVCKVKQPHKSNFCPNCGADMREDGE